MLDICSETELICVGRREKNRTHLKKNVIRPCVTDRTLEPVLVKACFLDEDIIIDLYFTSQNMYKTTIQ